MSPTIMNANGTSPYKISICVHCRKYTQIARESGLCAKCARNMVKGLMNLLYLPTGIRPLFPQGF